MKIMTEIIGTSLSRKREINQEKMTGLKLSHKASSYYYSQAYVMVLARPLYHKDLFDYITEKRRLNENEARRIFLQIIEAVMYCESKGIFHRDIKDENILLDTRTGQVKLLDFGLGTVLENTLYTDYEGKKPYKLVGNSL